MKTPRIAIFVPSMMMASIVLTPEFLSRSTAQSVDTSLRDVQVDTSAREIQVDTSSMDIQVDRSSLEIPIDKSTGEVNNSSSSRSVVGVTQPVPAELVAKLEPADTSFKAKGDLRFSIVGDVMTGTGRIEGLEPNSRYQLSISPMPAEVKPDPQPPAASASVTPQTDGIQRNDKDPATGGPLAGTPQAGSPQASPPQAGKPDAGQPDGQDRQGAPGGGEGTSVTGGPAIRNTVPAEQAKPQPVPESNKITGLLGVVTADAQGTSDVNLNIRSVTLTAGKGEIQGRSVTLTTAPMDGAPAPVMVASGILEVVLVEVKQPE
ncbi:MAG: hypothetical protein EOP85_11575 [Verrucomicrobiaceae bacterium]|nr:MAG: hypothetical protein EOP85_11575 [Verrucomicrobiaceae bacterium]